MSHLLLFHDVLRRVSKQNVKKWGNIFFYNLFFLPKVFFLQCSESLFLVFLNFIFCNIFSSVYCNVLCLPFSTRQEHELHISTYGQNGPIQNAKFQFSLSRQTYLFKQCASGMQNYVWIARNGISLQNNVKSLNLKGVHYVKCNELTTILSI